MDAEENLSKKNAMKKRRTNNVPTGFLEYFDDFRKKYELLFGTKHEPIIVVEAAASAWEVMTESEKAPFVSMAEDKVHRLDCERAAYAYYKNQHVSSGDESGGDDSSGVGSSGVIN